ncbi:MAG: hypothetical protein JWQ57_4336 [Mucilaginibacter sp.]|nr:hypothetical protein [Mucilaginibacter sp.]
MDTTLSYFNEYGDEITFAQASQLTKYRIMVSEGNKRLRYETYTNGLKSHTSYYINSEAEIQGILTMDPNASFIIESVNGKYTISDERSYRSGILAGKRMYADDTVLNEIICMQIIDPMTGVVIHNQTEKSYFDAGGTEIYSFSYNADGSCFFIEKVQEFQTDFYATAIGNDPDIDFTWQGFEYYQYSEPLIPGGTAS